MWQTDQGRRGGRQVIFHVSPKPGRAPTSSQALCNYLLPRFQPKAQLFLTLCPWRKGGSVSANLLSALPRQHLVSLTHPQRQTTEGNQAHKYKSREAARGAQVKCTTYFAGYACLQFPEARRVSDNENDAPGSPRGPRGARSAAALLPAERRGASGSGPSGSRGATRTSGRDRRSSAAHRPLPIDTATGCRWCRTREGESPGARTSRR